MIQPDKLYNNWWIGQQKLLARARRKVLLLIITSILGEIWLILREIVEKWREEPKIDSNASYFFVQKKLRYKFSIPKNGCGSYFFVQKIISKKENPDRSPGYNEELFSTEDNLFPSKQMYGKEMVSANSYFLVIHHKEIKSSRKHLSTPYLYVVRKKRAIFI